MLKSNKHKQHIRPNISHSVMLIVKCLASFSALSVRFKFTHGKQQFPIIGFCTLARPTVSPFQSLKISRTTFRNYTKFSVSGF